MEYHGISWTKSPEKQQKNHPKPCGLVGWNVGPSDNLNAMKPRGIQELLDYSRKDCHDPDPHHVMFT